MKQPTTVLLTSDGRETEGLGGKGRSLAALISAGFPVPTTGVVTTNAYRWVARTPGIAAFLDGIIGGDSVDADDVDRRFREVDLPSDLTNSLLELARVVGRGGPIAVRSSATVEDLHGSSFAGQYRSILNIDSTDPDEVLTAIRNVWSSLWHPAPTTYRRAFDIDEADVMMAVVLMEMVPATTAGVVFTIDPGGELDAARVEAVEGLGEALVSGARTPSAWVVPRGGSAELPAVPSRALELALSVEEMTGVPQDIEWAAVGGEVTLVQARPITVLETDDGFDTPIDDHELTTAGLIEMVPGVLPALRWDLNQFLLEEAFRSVLDSLGILRGSSVEDRPFVRRVRGRVAMDFDQLRAAAATVPGAVEELEAQYFGTPQAEPTVKRSSRPFTSVIRDLRSLRTRRKVIEAAEVLIGTVAQLRTAHPDFEALDDKELIRYIRRLVDLAGRGLAAELGVAASGAASFRRLELQLEEHLGAQEAASVAQTLTGSSSLTEARSVGASAAIFAGETWNELGVSPPDPRQAGPERQQEELADLEERLAALPGWRRRRILTGQFVDLRIHVVRRTVAEVTDQLRRRERSKAAFLELGGEVRRGHLVLGERLVERGLLHDANAVELLASRELVEALENGRIPARDVLGRRRNWLSRFEAEGQLPVRFTGVPEREAVPLPEGQVLSGWAASPGRQRGTARVVSSPRGRFDRGEILVAETTDASWSPLFVRAGGVVVERGGPLSHAAILARELGIPAVLNLPGATGVLDGCEVLVDGDQGVIVIEADGRGR